MNEEKIYNDAAREALLQQLRDAQNSSAHWYAKFVVVNALLKESLSKAEALKQPIDVPDRPD